MEEMIINSKELAGSIGANVTRLRKAKGWSQTELAGLVGASYVQINRVENGHNVPSAELLYSLADLFGVSADSLRQTALRQTSEKIPQTT